MPGLYTLTYGAVGSVDEFVCKVWPFWMVMPLAAAILSLGQVWRRPRPLPFFTALILAFLPATLIFPTASEKVGEASPLWRRSLDLTFKTPSPSVASVGGRHVLYRVSAR